MSTSVIIAGIVVLFLAATIYYNSKVTVEEEREETNAEDYWYAGLIYINPEDKRPFVPKRFGGGFTVNFGNSVGVISAILLLGLIGWLIYAGS